MTTHAAELRSGTEPARDPQLRLGWPQRLRRHIGSLVVAFVTLSTLGSGLFNISSVLNVPLPERHSWMREVFPLAAFRLSRFSSLLVGFALVVSSLNIFRRKRRAWQVVLALSMFAFVSHLVRGLDVPAAASSLGLAVVLLLTRDYFTVRSSLPDLRLGLLRLVIALAVALAYGVAGFWLLDPRHFGINFHIGDAIRSTLDFFSLLGDPGLVPRTHYARWFADSLYLIAIVSYTYAGLSIFRPIVYRFHTLPHERALATAIARRHGRSTLDFFKLWKDKSYFFDPSHQCFIAFRVAAGFAIALGDPVGPEERIADTVRHFRDFCRENDWKPVFHQTLPDFLPIYRSLGFRKLKIGDDAIIDLTRFTLEGKAWRSLRSRNSQLEKSGVYVQVFEPPVPAPVLQQAEEVSQQWLRIPGRRERSFTLGAFEREYVRNTTVIAAFDAAGRMLAFVNQPPCYRPGEATIDLMRRREDVPNGIMDYLFVKVFQRAKQQGYARFSLGMAPMSGFEEREHASLEERAIHNFFQRLNFLFSYEGLRHYKGKFAHCWEPRYIIYRNPLDLPRLAIAIGRVSSYREAEHTDEEAAA